MSALGSTRETGD